MHTDDGARLAVSVLAPRAGRGGATVVLSHGWAANRMIWGMVADLLRDEGHTVVTYDQRGHGASTLGREPIGIKRFGADLATVLSQVEAPDAIVVGHSGGGFAAMSYVVEDPDRAASRVRALLLLGTAAHNQETPDSEVKMMGSGLFSWALNRPWLGRKLLGQTMGKKPEQAQLELNRQMFAATPPAVRADCFRSSRGMDMRAALADVRIPTLVMAGEQDKVVSPDLGRIIAHLMPNATYQPLLGVGHMLPLEAPIPIARAVGKLANR